MADEVQAWAINEEGDVSLIAPRRGENGAGGDDDVGDPVRRSGAVDGARRVAQVARMPRLI
ncbi:MAG: hypothetical protein OXF27_12295 [Acidobacteria bacterium]|nr:hypothetical protein [Acidobacteriota bacterium]